MPAPSSSRKTATIDGRECLSVPRNAKADQLPDRGNYVKNGKLFRVCTFTAHEGPRHLPADRFAKSTKISSKGAPCDVCRECLTKRARGYGQTVKRARDEAAGIRLTPAQRTLLTDLPEVTNRNRKMYEKLVDLGAVRLNGDAIRTTLGTQLIAGAAR